MTNYRSLHKAALKTILEAITVAGTQLQVYPYIQTHNDQWPYACITSDEFINNTTNGNTTDFATYLRGYRYSVIVVHTIEGEKTQQELEDEIDLWESAIVDSIQSRASRDASTDYLDMAVLSTSSPISAQDMNISEGQIAKIYTVELQVLHQF